LANPHQADFSNDWPANLDLAMKFKLEKSNRARSKKSNFPDFDGSFFAMSAFLDKRAADDLLTK
jgi:hypothetical protein